MMTSSSTTTTTQRFDQDGDNDDKSNNCEEMMIQKKVRPPSSSNSGGGRGRGRRRRVRFTSSKKNTVLKIPNYVYTEEEAQSLWYSKYDIQSMRNSRRDDTPRKRRQVVEDDDEDHDTLQLYRIHVTPIEVAQYKTVVLEAKLAVFMEQMYQWEEDDNDKTRHCQDTNQELYENVELLADVYFESTKQAQWEAKERGQLMAVQVDKLYNSGYFHDDDDDDETAVATTVGEQNNNNNIKRTTFNNKMLDTTTTTLQLKMPPQLQRPQVFVRTPMTRCISLQNREIHPCRTPAQRQLFRSESYNAAGLP